MLSRRCSQSPASNGITTRAPVPLAMATVSPNSFRMPIRHHDDVRALRNRLVHRDGRIGVFVMYGLVRTTLPVGDVSL